jgi:Alw26I/Eco31I/Esp3I family type II restriction endonuclease
MSRESNQNHKEFSKYQKFIVDHENYRTLPNKTNHIGEITWVKVKDSERAEWWDELKVKLKHSDRATVARNIHPKELGGYKPCQICGRRMSIFMVYPALRTTEKINFHFPTLDIEHFGSEISEIVKKIEIEYQKIGLQKIASVFNISETFRDAEDLSKKIIANEKHLSPGVMSNAPDRLDGFHTYNACCRSVKDTGRHSSNLSRYSTDRRAYENWADGNWRGADRLMGKFKESREKVICKSCGVLEKMTADHIGPISLGFAHRMEFTPICKECNSKKNNRMTMKDISKLLEAENLGEEVISWHSKALWDSLKYRARSDRDALVISKILRQNMHYVMCILSDIHTAGHRNFLESFLHPEYSNFEYEFTSFDVKTGKFQAKKIKVNSLNTIKLSRRYIRISFESLGEYSKKMNRKSERWNDSHADRLLSQIILLLNSSKTDFAKNKLHELLAHLASQLSATFESFE